MRAAVGGRRIRSVPLGVTGGPSLVNLRRRGAQMERRCSASRDQHRCVASPARGLQWPSDCRDDARCTSLASAMRHVARRRDGRPVRVADAALLNAAGVPRSATAWRYRVAHSAKEGGRRKNRPRHRGPTARADGAGPDEWRTVPRAITTSSKGRHGRQASSCQAGAEWWSFPCDCTCGRPRGLEAGTHAGDLITVSSRTSTAVEFVP